VRGELAPQSKWAQKISKFASYPAQNTKFGQSGVKIARLAEFLFSLKFLGDAAEVGAAKKVIGGGVIKVRQLDQ
jgi:hypothetical protein